MEQPEPKYKGARFYKCALQVNSHAYPKYRGEPPHDEETYNRDVLYQCKANKIDVVGLAEHGNIMDYQNLWHLLRDVGVVVFPGFEICSSEGIHFVCLFHEETTKDQLIGYIARFEINTRQPADPSNLNASDIFGLVGDLKGVVYAAHCIHDKGVLKKRRPNVWKNNLLRIAQIPKTVPALKQVDGGFYFRVLCNKEPEYRRDKPIAVINAKDVWKPEHLEEKSASCLIKMTDATFDSFAMAFGDSESRVRLNHDMPDQKHSVLCSIQWHGHGFFGKSKMALSHNLNTVIGGRGTGKSTLVESLRFVLDMDSRGEDRRTIEQLRKRNLADSQVVLKVQSKEQGGNHYWISRRSGERPVVTNPKGEVSNLSPSDILPGIEILGQNEILEIEKSDAAKHDLISRFFPDRARSEQAISDIRRQLKVNRERFLATLDECESLDTKIAQTDVLKDRLAQFQQLGIEKKLENVKLLVQEKNLQEEINDQLDAIESWLSRYQQLFALSFFQRKAYRSLPNDKFVKAAEKVFADLESDFDEIVHKMKASLGKVRLDYENIFENWNKESDELRKTLEEAIAKLPDQEGKSGSQLGAEYAEIIRQLGRIENLRKDHGSKEKFIQELRMERDKLLEQYRKLAFSHCESMKNVAELVNQELEKKVHISVTRMGDLSELRDFLCNLDGIGKSRVAWLDGAHDDLDLVQWAKWSKDNAIKEFMGKYKKVGLTQGLAEKLCNLSDEQRMRLEEIYLQDSIEIELNVSRDGSRDNFEPLANLSTGQKCTAILHLLLLARDAPLIIDQPEDNLDNAFIADRIVRDLRDFKNKRQFLFATHNPNIPIFGDAELIVVLECKDGEGRIADEGAIDKPSIRREAAEVLEGGRAAFEMRKVKYGF